MRIVVSIIAVIILCNLSFAQQDPQFSLNMFNQLTINPAYAGCNNAICGMLLHRSQWLGFEKAPRTDVVNLHGSIDKYNSGVGMVILQEGIGFEKNLEMNLNYAYRLPIGKTGMLSLGLSFGLFNKSINGEWTTPDMLDPGTGVSSPYDDPSVPYSQSKVVFDAGFGAFFRTSEGLYAGISATHLPQSRIKFSSQPISFLKRHYYLMAGYSWTLPMDPRFVLRPNLFIKYDGVTPQYDVNLLVEFKKMIWGGLSYRLGDAFVPMVGVHLPMNIRFSIAYDFTTSDIGSYSYGSVEIMAGYCFTLQIQSQRGSYKSVRFL